MRRNSGLTVMFLSILCIVEGEWTVNVTSETCEQEFDLVATGAVTLDYYGADLGVEPVCKVKFYSDDSYNDLCVSALEFVNSCKVTVEYHGGQYQSYDPEIRFCHTEPQNVWCSSFHDMYVSFEKMQTRSIEGEVRIRLQITTKSTKGSDHNGKVVSLTVLIGLVVVAVVVLIALLTTAGVLYYRRVRSKEVQQRYRAQSARSTRSARAASARTGGRTPTSGNVSVSRPASASAVAIVQPRNWTELGTIADNGGTDNPGFEGSPLGPVEPRFDSRDSNV